MSNVINISGRSRALSEELQAAEQTLIDRLNRARASVHVAVAALDAGETDLEQLTGISLRGVAESLDEVYDDLVAIGHAQRRHEDAKS